MAFPFFLFSFFLFISFLSRSYLFPGSPHCVHGSHVPPPTLISSIMLPPPARPGTLDGVLWRSYPLRARSYGVVLPTQTATPSLLALVVLPSQPCPLVGFAWAKPTTDTQGPTSAKVKLVEAHFFSFSSLSSLVLARI